MTYFNQIEKFTDYVVHVIHAKSSSRISGILTTPNVSLSSAVTYDVNPLNEAITGTGEGGVQALGGAILGNAGEKVASALVQASITHASTVRTFRGTSNDQISVSFKVFPNKFGMPSTYAAIEKMIQHLTKPRIVANQLNSTFYTADEAKDLVADQGRISKLDGRLAMIQIGEWLETPAIMYIDNIDRSYSTFTDIDGNPLYLDVTVTMSPYRAILSDDPVWIKK